MFSLIDNRLVQRSTLGLPDSVDPARASSLSSSSSSSSSHSSASASAAFSAPSAASSILGGRGSVAGLGSSALGSSSGLGSGLGSGLSAGLSFFTSLGRSPELQSNRAVAICGTDELAVIATETQVGKWTKTVCLLVNFFNLFFEQIYVLRPTPVVHQVAAYLNAVRVEEALALLYKTQAPSLFPFSLNLSSLTHTVSAFSTCGARVSRSSWLRIARRFAI